MQIRLSRAEYWILESLVQFKYPFSDYASPEHALIFNQPTHGLDRSELLDTFDDMVQKRWIEAHAWNDPERDDSGGPAFFPSKDEISRAMECGCRLEADRSSQPSSILYAQLTALGGSVWESFASPFWDRFIDDALIVGSLVGSAEVQAVEKWRLEKYLKYAHYMDIIVIHDTVTWDTVSPWQATYWKKLPRAHRVRFEFQKDDSDGGFNWDTIPYACMSMRQWYFWSGSR